MLQSVKSYFLLAIVPVTNISNRRNSAEGRKVLEKISYEHNMDSRQDPMYSERGKVNTTTCNTSTFFFFND